jgi:hypothetical protein
VDHALFSLDDVAEVIRQGAPAAQKKAITAVFERIEVDWGDEIKGRARSRGTAFAHPATPIDTLCKVPPREYNIKTRHMDVLDFTSCST